MEQDTLRYIKALFIWFAVGIVIIYFSINISPDIGWLGFVWLIVFLGIKKKYMGAKSPKHR